MTVVHFINSEKIGFSERLCDEQKKILIAKFDYTSVHILTSKNFNSLFRIPPLIRIFLEHISLSSFKYQCYCLQWTIYSATYILEKCRKVVLEKWFCKLGFFFLVNHFSPAWKKLDLWYKTTIFSGQPLFSNQISWTRFLQPDF